VQKDILTTAQAAKLLGVSIRTAQLWIEGGRLPSWKTPGGHRRVKRSDVLTLIEAPDSGRRTPVVVLVGDPGPTQKWRALLSGYLVDIYSDAYTAARGIDPRRSGAFIVELSHQTEDRFGFLTSLLADPEFRHAAFFAVTNLPREEVERRCGGGSRLTILKPRSVEEELPRLIWQSFGREESVARNAQRTDYPFPVPPNEEERARAVDQTGLLDTPPEEAFDALTWMATEFLHMPVSLVVLLSRDRQWFKSRRGLNMDQTPREWAFCNYTVLEDRVLVVNDLARDQRFAKSPGVTGGPRFRFYAGAPLMSDTGYALGSICVMDRKPREFGSRQKRLLSTLASLTGDEIRLRQFTRPRA